MMLFYMYCAQNLDIEYKFYKQMLYYKINNMAVIL